MRKELIVAGLSVLAVGCQSHKLQTVQGSYEESGNAISHDSTKIEIDEFQECKDILSYDFVHWNFVADSSENGNHKPILKNVTLGRITKQRDSSASAKLSYENSSVNKESYQIEDKRITENVKTQKMSLFLCIFIILTMLFFLIICLKRRK